jgi:hypothetical protein
MGDFAGRCGVVIGEAFATLKYVKKEAQMRLFFTSAATEPTIAAPAAQQCVAPSAGV